jgi:hypothetical protein
MASSVIARRDPPAARSLAGQFRDEGEGRSSALKPTSPQASVADVESGRAPLQEVLRQRRYLDVDLEQRDDVAALDPDLDLIGIHGDMFADRRENILAKQGNEIGSAGRSALMHQQDL